MDTTAKTTVGGDGEVENFGRSGGLVLSEDVFVELWGLVMGLEEAERG